MEDYAVVVAAAGEGFEVFAGLERSADGVGGEEGGELWERGHGRALLLSCPGHGVSIP